MKKILMLLVLPFILMNCNKDEEENVNNSPNNSPTVTQDTIGTFIDNRDGNEYHWVKIGNDIWMSENLAYKVDTGGCWAYNDDINNVNTYGYLYNWWTAKVVAPDGWHLATNNEWQEMIDFLGGEHYAGGKLKEEGTSHWQSPNTGGTNSSGFNGLPGGRKNNSNTGTFVHMGYYGYWWTSTQYENSSPAYARYLYNDSKEAVIYGQPKDYAFSVRCVKD